MSQAKAQTTLTRLKKLNLRNYAAPGTVGAAAAAAVVARHDAVPSGAPTESKPSTTKEDASEGSSSLTTTPLTSPLHTPVGEHPLPLPLVHEKEDRKKEEEEGEEEGCRLPASLSRFSGREREEGEEGGLAISPREGLGMDIIAGFPATMISGPTTIGAGGGEMNIGVSPPFSSSFGFSKGNGGTHWSWGAKSLSSPVPSTPSSSPDRTSPTPTSPKSSPPPHLPTPPGSKTTLPALLLDNIRKKSTHSPPRSPVPRRDEKAPAFLLEGGSSSSSSSGSDADVPVSKKSTLRGSVETLLQEEDEAEDEENGKVPSVPVFSYTPPTPRKAHHHHSTTTTTHSIPQTPSPSSSSDEIYQAFVRQWCFAQGPANLNHAVGGGGEKSKGGVVG